MKRDWLSISVVLVLVLAVAFAVTAVSASDGVAKKAAAKKLPKLLDLGSTKCVPCKMMAPILEELKKEYKGQLEVAFIDIGKDKEAARKYKITTIPTQIFYDAKGKELTRHVGYISKEDILKTFEKQGIKLKKPAKPK